jgi:hypothetical protein
VANLGSEHLAFANSEELAMRFIPTSTAKVESLKKQAKKLQRNGGGKHAELLDRVARGAGYEHWHHVTLCLRETTQAQESRSLLAEIDEIVKAALSGKGKIVVTGPEASTSQPFVLMSTDDGDAWMLDPEGDRALCLCWHEERQQVAVRDLPTRLEVEWDGTFELSGPFFVLSTSHALVGSRHIRGYPVDELRAVLEDVRSADKRIEGIFLPEDAVELTPDIIEQLTRSGWERAQLEQAARYGARYSPSRNTVLSPPVGNI